jgi:ferric-dicitrate binding protein FerR (iron transport regulator)
MSVIRFAVLILFLTVVAGMVPLSAQAQNAALGIVVTSSGGNIGNAAVSEGSSVYTGDYLSTNENGTLAVRIGGSSLQLEGSSSAHVYFAPYGAVVELDRGALRYTTPGTQQNLIIVASDVRVTPALGMPDFGRVSIDNPCNLTVYSQRGTATAQVGSESHLVEEGKAYRVRALNEVDYRQYVSPDVSDYHNHHQHRECPAPVDMVRGKPPIAGGQSRFLLVSAGVIGGVTTFGVVKAFESPSRP